MEDRVYESFKKNHDITKIYADTNVVEEHVIKFLARDYFDDPEVRQALEYYYAERNCINTPNIILIADTHLGGMHQDYETVFSVYEFAAQYNINNIIHLGDVIEGDVNPGSYTQSISAQLEEVLEKYPRYHGIMTHYIEGNHDIPNPRSKESLLAVREALSRRDDFHWLGTLKTYCNFYGKLVRLFHKEAYGLVIPEYPNICQYQFSGHSHEYKLDEENRNLVVPSLNKRSFGRNGEGFVLVRQAMEGFIMDLYRFDDRLKPVFQEEKVLTYKSY